MLAGLIWMVLALLNNLMAVMAVLLAGIGWIVLATLIGWIPAVSLVVLGWLYWMLKDMPVTWE
jgi:hypothetical protein